MLDVGSLKDKLIQAGLATEKDARRVETAVEDQKARDDSRGRREAGGPAPGLGAAISGRRPVDEPGAPRGARAAREERGQAPARLRPRRRPRIVRRSVPAACSAWRGTSSPTTWCSRRRIDPRGGRQPAGERRPRAALPRRPSRRDGEPPRASGRQRRGNPLRRRPRGPGCAVGMLHQLRHARAGSRDGAERSSA